MRKLIEILGIGTLTLASLVGCSRPNIEKNRDLTGDGIPDLIVHIEDDFQHGRWLFIGQKDGSFIRATEYKDSNVKYFKTDDGKVYFFDGEFYRLYKKNKVGGNK